MPHSILFTASAYSHIANFHRPYLRAFAERGWQVDVACGGTPIDIPEASNLIHIPLQKSYTSPRNLLALQKLRRTIERGNYSLISTHTALAAFFTRIAAERVSNAPPVVYTAHGYLFDEKTSGLKRKILVGAERMTAKTTDLLMTMNKWDTDFARENRLCERIVEIPGMGVDFSRFDYLSVQDIGALRASFGFPTHSFIYIYAAEFSARKNHAMLLRALQLLPPHICLVLPGEGKYRKSCMALAQELKLTDRVRFPAQVSNIPLWYAASDAAVTVSRSEGLPFNVMEAMYSRLPVAASAVKGHTDLIEHEQTGLLFTAEDTADCAAQLLRLAEDTAFAKKIAHRAHDAVLRYDVRQVLPQVLSVYDGLLAPADSVAASTTQAV